MRQRVWIAWTLAIGGLSLPVTPVLAQSDPCRVASSLACQNAQWDRALVALATAQDRGALPVEAQRLLVDFLKRPDMALAANEVRRAQALQTLAIVRLGLQDSDGSVEAGRQALAIWQKRANPADAEDRRASGLNLATALMISKNFDEAEVLGKTILEELGPPSSATATSRLAILELLSGLLAGRNGLIEELVRLRSEIVAVYRTQPVRDEEAATHRFNLARALGNLGDAQTGAQTFDTAAASLADAKALMTSLGLEDSDPEWVRLRSRYLPLLVLRGERCEVETVATALLPFAEPLGGRALSQILMQHGENYRNFGATSKAAPLWSRATGLELAMACPAYGMRSARSEAVCIGSPVLIDHLRAVGMSLRYERQGRASAGYRSLYQAGDFLRARTLGGFALNRDAANTYTSSRDIFRDQITTAWAVNDPTTVPKAVEVAWTCGAR